MMVQGQIQLLGRYFPLVTSVGPQCDLQGQRSLKKKNFFYNPLQQLYNGLRPNYASRALFCLGYDLRCQWSFTTHYMGQCSKVI